MPEYAPASCIRRRTLDRRGTGRRAKVIGGEGAEAGRRGRPHTDPACVIAVLKDMVGGGVQNIAFISGWRCACSLRRFGKKGGNKKNAEKETFGLTSGILHVRGASLLSLVGER